MNRTQCHYTSVLWQFRLAGGNHIWHWYNKRYTWHCYWGAHAWCRLQSHHFVPLRLRCLASTSLYIPLHSWEMCLLQFLSLWQSVIRWQTWHCTEACIYMEKVETDRREESFIASRLPTSNSASDPESVSHIIESELHVCLAISFTKRLWQRLSFTNISKSNLHMIIQHSHYSHKTLSAITFARDYGLHLLTLATILCISYFTMIPWYGAEVSCTDTCSSCISDVSSIKQVWWEHNTGHINGLSRWLLATDLPLKQVLFNMHGFFNATQLLRI